MIGLMLAFNLISLTNASAQQVMPSEPFVHAPVNWGDKAGEAEFHIVGDLAIITLRVSADEVLLVRRIENPSDALAVLADERLSFSWPALLTWAGSDLVVLRDKVLLRAKAAADIGLPNADLRGQTEENSGALQAAKLQYARVLNQSGRRKDAVTMLTQQIQSTPTTLDGQYDRMVLNIRLVSILFEDGDAAEVFNILDQYIKDDKTPPDARINYQVTLSQYLARSGNYRRALEDITKSLDDFLKINSQYNKSIKLPGSEAQFSWIQACALHGVGREKEAKAIVNSLNPALFSAKNAAQIRQARLNALLCMKDTKQLGIDFATMILTEPPASGLFQLLQPDNRAFLPERAVLRMAVKDPLFLKAASGHVRFLGGSLSSAVKEWRNNQ
ncbi:hypothetical protein C8J47_2453 [Sphingomonas sp. PP-F2F-G114-C0414]|uniref:tetratricopeptide repeat protein n=1 Tax=Sphingomonas sp. PP-F2F-G114-C0414 TaxID=2135662 RepID=UPI000F170041|nr:hypothetical protein [Sphingomonas sp. PP-F2F-G114-C0414]RMB28242.1 hypothetical protein C8J47_2453 [Sphingomonas sp. PP-F2F-G114-C0414]